MLNLPPAQSSAIGKQDPQDSRHRRIIVGRHVGSGSGCQDHIFGCYEGGCHRCDTGSQDFIVAGTGKNQIDSISLTTYHFGAIGMANGFQKHYLYSRKEKIFLHSTAIHLLSVADGGIATPACASALRLSRNYQSSFKRVFYQADCRFSICFFL